MAFSSGPTNRPFSRRMLIKSAGVAAAGTALTAPSKASAVGIPTILPSRKFNQDSQKISAVVPSFQATADGFMEEQAQDFRDLTGIEVEMQFLPFERAMDRQTTLVAAQSGEVDVFGTHYAQIGKFGEGMVDLTTYAARDGVIAEDYAAGSFSNLSVGGKLLAIPFTYDLRTLFYRTDLFEEAGIAAPPTTWEEFLDAAMKTNNPPDVFGWLGVGKGDPVLREFSDRIWENGGDFLEDGLNPSRPAWNQPAAVEALQWYKDLIYVHKVAPPGTAAYGWEENAQLFASGQAAMSKQWGTGTLSDPSQSVIVDKFAIATLPAGKTNRTTAICHGRGINIYSDKQDAAWEYVKYVTSAEQLVRLFDVNGSRPAHIGGLDQAREKAEGVVKQNLEISLAQAANGYTWPLFSQFAEVQPILWGEIEKVLSDQKEPQEALDYAAEEAIKIFERDGLI